jgi:hypothetical protein
LRRKKCFKFISSCFKFVSEVAGIEVVTCARAEKLVKIAENAGFLSEIEKLWKYNRDPLVLAPPIDVAGGGGFATDMMPPRWGVGGESGRTVGRKGFLPSAAAGTVGEREQRFIP